MKLQSKARLTATSHVFPDDLTAWGESSKLLIKHDKPGFYKVTNLTTKKSVVMSEKEVVEKFSIGKWSAR